MTAVLHTLLSLVCALGIAAVVGLALGRAATQWFGGRGFSNLLMDVRGAMLSFLVALLLLEILGFRTWLAVGVVVGVSQAVAVSRWLTRRSGEWSPALVGGIALGRSTSELVTRRAATRGAVTATLSTTLLHLVTLEGLLYWISGPAVPTNLGGLIAASSRGVGAVWGLGLAVGLLGLEALASSVFQRNRSSDGPSR